MDAFHFRSLLLATIFNHSECCIPLSSSLSGSTLLHTYILFNFQFSSHIYWTVHKVDTTKLYRTSTRYVQLCWDAFDLVNRILFSFSLWFQEVIVEAHSMCVFLLLLFFVRALWIVSRIFKIEYRLVWNGRNGERDERPRSGKVKCAQKSSLTNVHFSTFSRIAIEWEEQAHTTKVTILTHWEPTYNLLVIRDEMKEIEYFMSNSCSFFLC